MALIIEKRIRKFKDKSLSVRKIAVLTLSKLRHRGKRDTHTQRDRDRGRQQNIKELWDNILIAVPENEDIDKGARRII